MPGVRREARRVGFRRAAAAGTTPGCSPRRTVVGVSATADAPPTAAVTLPATLPAAQPVPPPPARARHLLALLVGWPVLRATAAVAAATVRNAWRHRVLGLSAEAGFWQLLSLPSALLGLLGTIGYFSGTIGRDTVDEVEARLLQAAGNVLTPDAVATVVQPTLAAVLHGGRAAVVSVGFVLSLWSGSSAMATFVNQIAIAYEQRDERGAVRSRLLALLMYVVSMAAGVVLLPTLVAGPTLLSRLPAVHSHRSLVRLVQFSYWPVVGGLSLLALTSLYHFALPLRQRWRHALPGALTAAALWLIGSYGLRAYVGYVFHRTLDYGAFAAPVAVLLFFYVTALAVLVGAEVNAEIGRRRGTMPTRPHSGAASNLAG
jgi:membrane protein